MSILVTGSRGLVGTRLFQLFGDKANLISADLADGYDILDAEALLKKTAVDIAGSSLDAIIHLAAYTDVSAAHAQTGDESSLCYKLNVTGTENVIKLANHYGAHLVHISTDFVFDGKLPDPISETAEPNPIEWYGETKYIAEQRVTADCQSGWTIARIAFPYLKEVGIRPDLVANIRQKLANGDKLFLFDDQWITPSFIDDIVSGLFSFAQVKPEAEIFHLTGPEFFTPHSLGEALVAIDGVSSPDITATSVVEYLKKDPRPRQQFTKIDTTKYQSYCQANNLTPPISVKQALS